MSRGEQKPANQSQPAPSAPNIAVLEGFHAGTGWILSNPCGGRRVTGWSFKKPWGPASPNKEKKKKKKIKNPNLTLIKASAAPFFSHLIFYFLLSRLSSLGSASSSTTMPLLSLNHVSFLCKSVSKSFRFYEDVLGFVLIKRPSSFDFEGTWYALF
jgi:hypothetical protein